MDFTHLDENGDIRMVDVSQKDITLREATAEGNIRMRPETFTAVRSGTVPKGDVLAAARIAGVMAAKKTADLIPMCHILPLSFAQVELTPRAAGDGFTITATVRCTGRTGVEMEALTAVAVAALTVYDMCKAVDRGMEIGGVHLLRKSGGKSGEYVR